MAFITTLKYVTMLYSNAVTTTTPTAGTPTGAQHRWTTSWVSISGQDHTMLDDDDATSLCKATSTLTDPILTIQFGTSQQLTAFGICNHNLKTSGVSELYLEHSNNGSSWTAIDVDPCGFPSGDRDLAVVFSAVIATYFRVRMRATGDTTVTPTAFYMGYVYWGAHYEFQRNPAQFVQTRRPAIRYLQSAGGMTHAIKGMIYRPATLEMNFIRAKGVDVQLLNLAELSQLILGVIPPESVPDPTLSPRGNDIFFGRLEEISVDPQTPSNIALQNEVYNAQVLMRGAV